MIERRKTVMTAALLSAAMTAAAPCISFAMPGPYNGRSGEGYRTENGVKDPDPINYDNQGSMRALRQNNVLETDIVNRIIRFSYRTAPYVLQNGQGNVSYSPVSLYYALGLAGQGAEGATRAQLMSVMGVPDFTVETLADQCGRVYRQMFRNNQYSQLKLINSLWLSDGSPLHDAFRITADSQYYTSVFRVNFADGNVPGIMNSWIAYQTDQAIVQDPPVSAGENMRFLNSVYFYSQWTVPFTAGPESAGVFRTADGREVSCSYMTGRNKESYYRGKGFQSADRSLKDGTMTFILPDEGVTIQSLLASEESVNEMFGHHGGEGAGFGGVSWKVPKFRSSDSMDMAPMLKNLGAANGFEAQTADFSHITGEAFSMAGVTQETVFQVDERGAGVGTVTPQPGLEGAASEEIHMEMHLNRPFLYIVSAAPGLPIYIGVCNNPEAL
ncbi:MAG: serpin family protein [Clostridium sp.]|nr:serpin family protein [Clostridium sp.]